MKITISLAVLALAASQAMAVVPIPIAGCTKKVVVLATDTGCADFAAKNGCTFDELLKWNLKLRPDCANLDVGAPLCVSMTAGAGGETKTSAVPVVPSGKPTAVPSNHSTATKTAVAPTSTTNTTAITPPPTVAHVNGASGNSKTSMVLSVAGIVLSAAYML
ncbi:hypothetical protein BGZ83_003193 [Gryganskiella cystojenkinii]|nr:hypothetical protein BGZ83_003193 [Gryganskiella cystojenkinii]